ncbi:hypothetical protein [Caldalkalibacillus mannanilyticus]|uniref:hypothetical protein n=1 Tax=Caldalkalibacillus mannanilyticus TaxID=1418 RepID=UPI00046980B7|nr:hypothetical protein [Caldalkalibacillus mannanilyticus]
MATIVNTLQLKNPMVTSLQDLNKYANVTAHHLEDLSPKFKNAFDVHIFDKAKKSMEVTGEVVNTVSKEIDKAEGKQSEFNEAVKQGEQQASGLKKAIIGLAKDGYKLVTGFMSESLDLANQQVAAEQRLHSIMSKVGGTTQEQVDQMKLLAAEMQGGTTIADQVGMTGMAELGSFNIGAESIQALTPALYDLAVAMHGVEVSQEEMMKTSKLVGEVMGGKVGEISKLGVSFNEAQMEILKTGSEAERAALLVDVLGQSFGGLAQDMAQTPQGVALQLANEWNNFKEVIGYGLVPVMLEFIETIQAHMPTIQEVFLTVFDTIIQLLGSILEYSSMVVDFFTNYWSIIEPVIWGIVAP